MSLSTKICKLPPLTPTLVPSQSVQIHGFIFFSVKYKEMMHRECHIKKNKCYKKKMMYSLLSFRFSLLCC
jgi:hypothetical protein